MSRGDGRPTDSRTPGPADSRSPGIRRPCVRIPYRSEGGGAKAPAGKHTHTHPTMLENRSSEGIVEGMKMGRRGFS